MVAGCSSPPQTAGLDGIYAPRGAEIIVVALEKRAYEACQHVARVHKDEGYVLRDLDADQNAVATEKQSLSISLGRRVDVRINAVIMDADEGSAVHVRGWFDSSVRENHPIGKALSGRPVGTEA